RDLSLAHVRQLNSITSCWQAAPARPVLGKPRNRAKPEPHGREQPVEDDERDREDEHPEHPPPQRHLRLRLHRATPAVRRSTARRMRCAISSIESSDTSITGQPSLRWMPAAYSSSW